MSAMPCSPSANAAVATSTGRGGWAWSRPTPPPSRSPTRPSTRPPPSRSTSTSPTYRPRSPSCTGSYGPADGRSSLTPTGTRSSGTPPTPSGCDDSWPRGPSGSPILTYPARWPASFALSASRSTSHTCWYCSTPTTAPTPTASPTARSWPTSPSLVANSPAKRPTPGWPTSTRSEAKDGTSSALTATCSSPPGSHRPTQQPEPSCKQLSWREPRSPTAPRVEGSGRTVLACPTPSRKRPPTNSAPEPARAGEVMHGRLRWLHRLPLAALRHATVSTVPRVQGQGRPPGQAPGKGQDHDRGSRELRRQPH